CFQCHKKDHLAANTIHPPAGQTPCFQCHQPHISDNRFFLKPQTE
ncbi:MAG: cytochrome C, partial [bacterium]|nr:cytochrome C [bacterium]